MTVYATKVLSDVDFGLALSHVAEVCQEVELKQNPPQDLLEAMRCGVRCSRTHGRQVSLYSNRDFDANEPMQPWCYKVEEVLSFYWYAHTKTIYYVLHEKGNNALLGFWFIHLLLPLYFALEEKYTVIHGGAVEVEGKAILFVAPSMGGKSTMTDYFVQKGHGLISDDKILTYTEEHTFMLAPSHPYHRPYRKHEELGYRVKHFSSQCKGLHAIYLLEKAQEEHGVTIEALKGFEKVQTMMPHVLYHFPFLKHKQMMYLAAMMNSIEVFRVKRPWDMEKLEDVYGAIAKHSKAF